MQESVKLLVDSFGPDILRHLALLFTKAYGTKSPEEARDFANEIAAMIATFTGVSWLKELPFYQVDTHPEEATKRRVPESAIPSIEADTKSAIKTMVSWIKTRPAYSTVDAKAAEYEQQRLAREAKEKAEKERLQRERDNKVVKEDKEQREVVASSRKEPIFRTETHSNTKRRGGVAGLLGGTKTHTETKQVLTGHNTFNTMNAEERTVQTLGNGRKVYGEWRVTKTWEARA